MTDAPPDPSPRTTIIAFIVVALAILGGVALLLASRPQPVQITIVPPLPTATPAPTATREPVTVYVTGAVAEPETLVSLPYGSRVQDAVEAAGGATAEADMERVNLAGLLRDGDQIHVPRVGEEQSAVATPGGGGMVDVNTANAEELMQLPGIGPALAERIIEGREANGPYADLDALDSVEGIGPSLLATLEPRITFD